MLDREYQIQVGDLTVRYVGIPRVVSFYVVVVDVVVVVVVVMKRV
jgi:hypothetical protein